MDKRGRAVAGDQAGEGRRLPASTVTNAPRYGWEVQTAAPCSSRCIAQVALQQTQECTALRTEGSLPAAPSPSPLRCSIRRGFSQFLAGGAEGNRTPDLCSAIAALSHLSYSPAPSASGSLAACFLPRNRLPQEAFGPSIRARNPLIHEERALPSIRFRWG